MATNSSAHSANAGFNQSGGAYFMIMSPLAADTAVTASGVGITPVIVGVAVGDALHTYAITTAARYSGGAAEEPRLTLTAMEDIMKAGGTFAGLTHTEAGAFVGTGKLIRDMGKTIISNKVTYRKFEVVAPATDNSSGVVGGPATALNAGYASFYLQVGRDGNYVGAGPAPIIRYF